ncbi:MAG: CPBP family intramembrane metalloprotease, partial [Clostridia bacterium]|nr:CPBP family intramembrane metalloprotease [Clostridia bacterium]
MSFFDREPNPELAREKAEWLRGVKIDLRGAGWTMLATQLVHSWGAMILLAILLGWKLSPEISGMAERVSVLNMDEIYAGYVAPLLADALSSDWFADATAVLNAVIAALGAIPLAVYARRRSLSVRPLMGLQGLSAGEIAALYLAVMGVNALGALGVTATEALFNRTGFSIYIDIMAQDTPFSFWVMSAYAVLLAPLIEEYMYRGVLLEGLRRYGERFAVVSSAVIFGLAHGNLMQFLPAALIGWFLGYVRVKTGSLGVCMLLHALNNLTSILLEQLMNRVASDGVYMAVNLGYIAVTVIAFAMVWRGLKKRRGELAEAEQPDVVMTDIKMPYMDGLVLARELKRRYPEVRILIFS